MSKIIFKQHLKEKSNGYLLQKEKALLFVTTICSVGDKTNTTDIFEIRIKITFKNIDFFVMPSKYGNGETLKKIIIFHFYTIHK